MVAERIGRAAARTVLFFAGLHLIVLGVAAARTGDFSLLNLFRILELDTVFATAPQSDFLAWGVLLVVFASSYALSGKK